MKKYHGGCHCGAVQFDVKAEITSVVHCNCSYCTRKGMLLTFIPKTQFTVTTEETRLTEYRFNTKHIAHTFCKVCGVQCFGSAVGEDGVETLALNTNTLEDFSLENITVNEYDGKSR